MCKKICAMVSCVYIILPAGSPSAASQAWILQLTATSPQLPEEARVAPGVQVGPQAQCPEDLRSGVGLVSQAGYKMLVV